MVATLFQLWLGRDPSCGPVEKTPRGCRWGPATTSPSNSTSPNFSRPFFRKVSLFCNSTFVSRNVVPPDSGAPEVVAPAVLVAAVVVSVAVVAAALAWWPCGPPGVLLYRSNELHKVCLWTSLARRWRR
jgi:hypothetical protein